MRRLVPLLALCALAAPAAAQEVDIPHETFTLPNGLRVVVAEDHSTPIVAVNVWYYVGSGYERPGRTGFAHLFEHVMFEGSKNVEEGEFDTLLEAAGAFNNGSTTTDRTNYYEVLPSNALDLALWLEADRMGGLLDAFSADKLEGQREVVKNERRQRYENRPYGLLWEIAYEAAYPEGHPYSWTTIGSMDDLDAASVEDVSEFFRTYYAPNNAALSVVGDVEVEEVRRLAERYFGWIPRGPEVERPDMPVVPVPETRRIVREDRVTLPQLTMLWRTGPRFGDDEAAFDALASIMAGGKTSRLYRRLVYDEQTAQSVSAFNWAKLLAGDLFVTVLAKPDVDLDAMEGVVEEELARLAAEGPTAEELDRVKAELATGFVRSLETVQGKADQLNSYWYYAGDPGYAQEDLARYRRLTVDDVQRAAQALVEQDRIVISFVPQGRTELGAEREVAR